jgi:hypothetical protein
MTGTAHVHRERYTETLLLPLWEKVDARFSARPDEG